MAKVVAEMSMSLDGFIADPTGGVGELFGWYANGPVAVAMPGSAHTFRVSEASAGHLREGLARIGSLVTGRRTFDIAEGFGGSHPYDVPVFVVTHTIPAGWPRADAPFTFVTEGVERAVAQARAVVGDKCVGVGAADIVRQCLAAGLLDEIVVNLVPVLLGKGTHFFDQLAAAPIALDTPRVVEGTGVTHLYYCVRPR